MFIPQASDNAPDRVPLLGWRKLIITKYCFDYFREPT
jgi:hypothetical protein